MISFNLSSQTVINKVNNDSVVILSKDIAIKVAKELNEKDKLVKDIELLKVDTSTLLRVISRLDKDIELYKKKDLVYESILVDQKKLQDNYEQTIKIKDKKLSWSKTKTTISQILLVSLGIFTIIKL